MTRKEKEAKRIEANLKKISKKAKDIVNKFCNGSLARGVTAESLSKVLR